jgi:hypothetical protein
MDRVLYIRDPKNENQRPVEGKDVVDVRDQVTLDRDITFIKVFSLPVWHLIPSITWVEISYVVCPEPIPRIFTGLAGQYHPMEDSEIGSCLAQAARFFYMERASHLLILDANGVCGPTHSSVHISLSSFIGWVKRQGWKVLIWTSSGRPISPGLARLVISHSIDFFDRRMCVYSALPVKGATDSLRTMKGPGCLHPRWFATAGGRIVIVDDARGKWESWVHDEVSGVTLIEPDKRVMSEAFKKVEELPWMHTVREEIFRCTQGYSPPVDS